MKRPLAIDLFCGLGGWTDGLLTEGYDVIGFDITQHVYGDLRYPAQLVVQDVTTLHGSQFRNADLIVASPPCQEYSYMAMPWSMAKAKAAAIRADATGAELERLNRLFNASFRIQREACEAAGRHIPLIVENVKGAQPWVGRSRWNFGSFYLWGDVPALMPVTFKGAKVPGISWRGYGQPGYVAKGFNTTADQRQRQNPDGRKNPNRIEHVRDGAAHTKHLTNPSEHGRKGGGGSWFHEYGPGQGTRNTSSGSNARKMASAMIAKIPLPLSSHIAATFKPDMRGVA